MILKELVEMLAEFSLESDELDIDHVDSMPIVDDTELSEHIVRSLSLSSEFYRVYDNLSHSDMTSDNDREGVREVSEGTRGVYSYRDILEFREFVYPVNMFTFYDRFSSDIRDE